MITKYRSNTAKIYHKNDAEFVKEVNRVLEYATGKMSVDVKNATADFTTTKNCSIVYYYTEC